MTAVQPRHFSTQALLASDNAAPYPDATPPRPVKLFKNGANQALRIPKELELPGSNALIHREGTRLIIEAAPGSPPRGTAAALLLALEEMASLGSIDEEFADVDAGLLPLDGIKLDGDAP
jgi:antitoxin VapB